MGTRELTVVAVCYALLVSLTGAAGQLLNTIHPAHKQASPLQPSPLKRYNGPPECNPTRGHALPKHCQQSSRIVAARKEDNRDIPTIGDDAVYRGPPECNPIRGQALPDYCKQLPGQAVSPSSGRSGRSPDKRVVFPDSIPPTTTSSKPYRPESATPAPADAEVEDEDVYVPFAGQRLDAFDWRLVRALDAVARTNAVVSPVGVKMVLGLLHEAASRDSATELRQALGLPPARPSARGTFRRILQSLQEKQDGYIMKVGNRVFLDKAYEPRSSIVKIYQSFYSAEIEQTDFRTPATVKPSINKWVSNFTNGLINQLITNDRQVQDLVSMLLNVIYFKGDWLFPFQKQKTSTGPFYVDSENTVTVDYMYITRDLFYSESKTLDAKFLRLPYKGNKYSMFFILPNKKHNLNQTIQLITPELVREQLYSLNKTEVKVKLPKFIFQYTVHLKELLQKVGISRIFTQSDEINMTKNKTNMRISKVIQKVGLEVNEEGTQATSVTEVSLENHFGGPIMFAANHPFLFFVEEEKTGTIVFIGKVIDPSYVKTALNSTTSTRQPPIERNFDTLLEKDFSKDVLVQSDGKHTPPLVPSE
ncbi:hypothetical protein R5R35_006964 [Gryllus longicercus]|uniref:Serpin domain-containing protein n=1 Tax=Gryllus longicercus TaxID=2509291 RepID=A0AAN9VS73_9ORTH